MSLYFTVRNRDRLLRIVNINGASQSSKRSKCRSSVEQIFDKHFAWANDLDINVYVFVNINKYKQVGVMFIAVRV